MPNLQTYYIYTQHPNGPEICRYPIANVSCVMTNAREQYRICFLDGTEKRISIFFESCDGRTHPLYTDDDNNCLDYHYPSKDAYDAYVASVSE